MRILSVSILLVVMAIIGKSTQLSAESVSDVQLVPWCTFPTNNSEAFSIAPDSLAPHSGDSREKLEENIARLKAQYTTLFHELKVVLKKYKVVQTGFGTEGALKLNLSAWDIDIERYRAEVRCLDTEMERIADTHNANLMAAEPGIGRLPQLGRYHPHVSNNAPYLPRGLNMELFLISDHRCFMSTTKSLCEKRVECNWVSTCFGKGSRAKCQSICMEQ
jgi:hypothetical protein